MKAWAKGGMATKLTAARIATATGCATVICQASQPENVLAILEGAKLGTVFHAHPVANRYELRFTACKPVGEPVQRAGSELSAVSSEQRTLKTLEEFQQLACLQDRRQPV